MRRKLVHSVSDRAQQFVAERFSMPVRRRLLNSVPLHVTLIIELELVCLLPAG